MKGKTTMRVENKLTVLSILCLSLLTMSIGATAATIPEIAAEFPNVSRATIELTVTIPSITMAIFVIVSKFLDSIIETRKIILVGLSLVIISTVMSLVSPSITFLLFSRALLGAGIGLFNSLAVSMIDFLYNGSLREKLLGYQNTFQGIGATTGALLVSLILMAFNWRMAFLIYLISVPIFILDMMYTPNVNFKNDQADDAVTGKLSNSGLKKFGYYFILLFVLMVAYMTINIKSPSFIADSGIGNASMGSLSVVVMSVGTIFGGLMYGPLVKITRQYTLFVSVGLMFTAMYILSGASSVFSAFLRIFIIGYCFGLYVPAIFSRALSTMPPRYSNGASTVLLIGSNMANFLCPYVDKVIDSSNDARILFLRFGILLTVLAAWELVHAFKLSH